MPGILKSLGCRRLSIYPTVPLPYMGPTGYPPIGGGPSRKPEDTRFIDDGLKELLAS